MSGSREVASQSVFKITSGLNLSRGIRTVPGRGIPYRKFSQVKTDGSRRTE